MSYLNSTRLHFAGQFQANVSTVNNDPGHFDNATFIPSYQEMQGPNFDPPNGWFNPEGDAAFRLLGCRVTSAWLPTGPVTNDPILQFLVADSDTRVCAKLVDLDSEQQLVSEIWGLQVRITDAQGNTLLRGDYDPAAFIDIWDRAIGSSSGGDVDAGAMYQSVLRNLWWGDVSASPFLMALQSAAVDGLLSIKFNVDSLNLDFTSDDFMCGRIVGTIGPASATEPFHMVMGRQFMAIASPPSPKINFFFPSGGINFMVGVVSEADGCIYLDLGNALSTTKGGGLSDLGDLTLGVYDPLASPGNPAGSVVPLGIVPSQGPTGYASDPTWYTRTAGIVVLPLTAAPLQAVSQAPLLLYVESATPPILISEWNTGSFVRADKFVFRLSPGDPSVEIAVYASQWGQPLAGATINFVPDASQLQPSNNISNDVPPVAVPLSALHFNANAVTNAQGVATLSIKASNPGTPRYFNQGQDYGLDGQVYGIRPAFANSQFSGPVNQWNFISFLVWSAFEVSDPATWDDLQPIFQQYANLYPVMNRFLNLGDYDSVKANARLLALAFSLDVGNANSMPVTRDLSPAKRRAILNWLKNPLPGAKCVAKAPEPSAARPAAVAGERPSFGDHMPKGGKAAAAARRLVLTNHH
ncbi:MAG: hypothetical protein QOK24_2774 [Verrucomicrobiota bacterium]|jgi:hypothetical protein